MIIVTLTLIHPVSNWTHGHIPTLYSVRVCPKRFLLGKPHLSHFLVDCYHN